MQDLYSNEILLLCVLLFLLHLMDSAPVLFLFLQIARKVGCSRTSVDDMIQCLKMSDPVGLTMAGKIDVLLILGKGQSSRDPQKRLS